jgi:hypothetical protein
LCHKIKGVSNGANTWKCWDPGEGESKVTNHGWLIQDCFCRKQLRESGFGQGLVKRSLCRVKCRMHGLDDSTPLSFFPVQTGIPDRENLYVN